MAAVVVSFWALQRAARIFLRAVFENRKNAPWLAAARKHATAAVLAGDTVKVHEIVFDRLYVLRNQLVHGGATCGSRVNREQLKQACFLLAEIVPVMIRLMAKILKTDWGEVMYPVMGAVPLK